MSAEMPTQGIREPFSTERARGTVAICAVFMFVATVAVVMRFCAKRLKRNKPGLDDWLIIIGLIFYYLSALQTILQVRLGGLGHHVNEGISPKELVITGKLGTYGQYAYALSMGAIRSSIIALFDRLFITKNFRRAALTVNIINVLWILFSIFIVSFRCIPFSKNWNMMEEGHCLPQVPIATVVAAWGLAIELVIWILPLPISWNLQLPLSSKIALTFIFGLGIFDIGVGIGRLVTILQVDTKDPTWTEVPALQWLAVEPSIAIVVACLCVCRPLLDFIIPERFRRTISIRTSRHSGSHNKDEHSGKLFGTSEGGTSHATATRTSEGSLATHSDEELEAGAVHVRKDIVVRADEKV